MHALCGPDLPTSCCCCCCCSVGGRLGPAAASMEALHHCGQPALPAAHRLLLPGLLHNSASCHVWFMGPVRLTCGPGPRPQTRGKPQTLGLDPLFDLLPLHPRAVRVSSTPGGEQYDAVSSTPGGATGWVLGTFGRAQVAAQPGPARQPLHAAHHPRALCRSRAESTWTQRGSWARWQCSTT